MIETILDASPIVLAAAIWTWVIRDMLKTRRDRREATASLRRARARHIKAWIFSKSDAPRGPDGLLIPPPEVAAAIDRHLDLEIAAELDRRRRLRENDARASGADRRARLNNSNDESTTRKENEND